MEIRADKRGMYAPASLLGSFPAEVVDPRVIDPFKLSPFYINGQFYKNCLRLQSGNTSEDTADASFCFMPPLKKWSV